MNILILDPEKKVSYRISKDTSGGYGTGNNFGDTIVPMFLKKTLKKVHDWPPMFAVYTMSALKKNGHKVDIRKICQKILINMIFLLLFHLLSVVRLNVNI